MRRVLIPIVLLACCGSVLSAQPPEWNKGKARDRLDERTKSWFKAGKLLKTDATGKVACLSCHTTFTYGLARPVLGKTFQDDQPALLDQLLKDTGRRLAAWPTAQVMYDFTEAKKAESRGTEAVLGALILAWNDSIRGRSALSEGTRQAFDRLWEHQRADGAWDWLRFTLEPWETKDAEYYGAALAAYAVGVAPGYYSANDLVLEKRTEALRAYLKNNRSSQNIYNQIWLLLASTRLQGLLEPAEKQTLIAKLKGMQTEGGWVLLHFGPWKYSEPVPPGEPSLSPGAKEPDGHATGLVTFTLLKAGVARDDPKVQAGLAWLKKSQRADGSWPGFSINKARAADEPAYHFMSDAATAWAVLALLEAGE